MPTHYHVLVKVKQNGSVSSVSDEVSRAMMSLSVSYTKAIYKRFGRVGALFQGQFQGKPINHYRHLLNLCMYIHTNPVKGGLVTFPEEWEFSNYLEWMELREGTLLNHEFTKDNFGAPDEYKTMVMEYTLMRNLPDDFEKFLLDLEN